MDDFSLTWFKRLTENHQVVSTLLNDMMNRWEEINEKATEIAKLLDESTEK